MNLGLCIANLLRRYPAVEVPGIGVFRKTHIPASYDEGRSAFLPPASAIELIESDTDVFPLVVYLQAQQQVDEPAAIRMLDEAVNEIMETISRNGQALLDGLGYLLADGASFVFKPFDIDGFGWKRIDAKLPALPREIVDEPVDDDLIIDGATTVDSYPRKRSVMGWIIGAAVVALLATAGIMWYYRPTWFDRTKTTELSGDVGGSGQRNQLANQGTPVTETPAVGSEVDSAAVDTARATALSTDSISIDPTPATKTAAEKPSVTYEIIVGSFATMAQARKFVTEMKAKGYDLHAIESKMPGNRKKISWGSFATEEEAYRELARVQKNFEPGAWIAKVIHD